MGRNNREVRQDETGAFRIRFPFDRALVDRIKTLPNRRWNATGRYWWVPQEDLLALVDLLQPLDFVFDAATCRSYREMGGTLSLDESEAEPTTVPRLPGLFDTELGRSSAEAGSDPAPDDYSVSRLNLRVQAVIEGAFPRAVWLVGEISGFNRNAHKRHVTFQIVEHDAEGKSSAKVDATLFEQPRRAIEKALRNAGDPFRLEDEISVRVLARVELYVPWGSYRVVVEELDPNYTLGEAARRREEILRRLREAGLVDRNRSLEFPAVPLRVGLITSLGSDAYNDVLRTLVESGYAFELSCHGARVQGRATEPSVLNALDYFRRQATTLDVVLICRGGGSRTDLAWFDSEALGRAVALFPLPVVIGIGHEQDHSVLDEVGWRRKTPTAAAGFLVETVRRTVESLEQSCAAILDVARRSLEEERRQQAERGRRLALAARSHLQREQMELGHRRSRTGRAAAAHLARQTTLLETAGRAVAQSGRRVVGTAGKRLAEAVRALGPRAFRSVAAERERTDQRARRLFLVHPRRVVERGYALLRTVKGTVLTDAAQAPSGTRLRVELRHGHLALRSEGVPDPSTEEKTNAQE